MSACETTVRRSKRDGLGEWGGLMGLRVTGLSGWDRAYQKEASPATYMSIELNILTLEMSGVDRRPAKEGEEVGANEFSVCSYYMEPMHGLGERVLRARAVLGNLFPACCAAPPARMQQMQSPPPLCPRVPCDVRGVPRSRACGHMRRQDSGSSRAGVGKLRHGRTSKTELRRLWTRSIVVKRTFSRGVSSWALSHSGEEPIS